jgi:hypothetical protein
LLYSSAQMERASRQYPRAKVFATARCSYGRKFGESTRVEAKVVCVGEGGVMLRTTTAIPTNESVHLTFMLAGSGLQVDSMASVRWWRKAPGGEREVGLQFQTPHRGVAAYVEKRLAVKRALDRAL